VQEALPHGAGTHVKTAIIWDVYRSHRGDETKGKEVS
jgi:hypothetical protein